MNLRNKALSKSVGGKNGIKCTFTKEKKPYIEVFMKKSSIINIVIADDHEIIREFISLFIKGFPQLKLVGLAKDGREAVRVVTQLNPHVVLMDVQMPNLDGFAATKKILQKNKTIKIIMFTALEKKDYFQEALNIGARGYLTKDTPPDEIMKAIQVVFRGGNYFHYKHAKTLTPVVSDLNKELFSQLSNKEEEILNLILQGNDTHDIATLLHRDERTIRMHREHIRKKLDVENDIQLILLAVKMGFHFEPN